MSLLVRTLLHESFTAVSKTRINVFNLRKGLHLIIRDMIVVTINRIIVVDGVVAVDGAGILLNTTSKAGVVTEVDDMMDLKGISKVITVLNIGKLMNESFKDFNPMVSQGIQI